MKAFILLSLACLAVSLPIHAGTGQADLDLPDSVYESVNEENACLLPPQLLPVTQPYSRGGDSESCSVASCPVSLTAATSSNAALFRRRRPRVWLSRVWRSRPKRLPPRVKPSKTLSEEPSKDHLALADPTSLPAPTAATSSNAALFRRRWLGIWLSRPKPLPPRVKPCKTLSEEPSKNHLALADPTSLPAPTAATSSNAALFRRRGLGVMLSPYRRPSRVKPSKTLSEEPSKEP